MTVRQAPEVRQLLGHYRCADAGARESGTAWYRASRAAAEDIAAESGRDYRTVAGVIAAMSPRQQWTTNVRAARTLCAGGTFGGLGTSLRAAGRILAGEDPADVLRGPKVSAFFRAIMGDEDSVVVDVWMVRAMGHDPTKTIAGRRYATLAGHVTTAARVAGIGPATFQAIVWTHVRGRAQ